ncbi:SUR7/PalI family-domain-containing protein [Penicillium sp. IBT 16267x]|nr:SUR7/PalI family-domain-containing protein [Penicillium sp. IBT 16267x]
MAVSGFGVFIALGLSIASLICILLVVLGGINKESQILGDLYAFQIDLKTFFANEPEGAYRGIIPGITNMTVGEIPGVTTANQAFADALWYTRGANELSQFYSIYLWDYCASNGSVVNSAAVCTQHGANATFNPFTAMNLSQHTGSQSEDTVYPTTLADGMRVYSGAIGWLRASFIIAAVAKFVELVIGVVAATSKWGSLFATFIAVATSVFILMVNITQTVIWTVIVAAWKDSLGSIGVNAHLGKGFMVTIWLSLVLSFSGSVWWLLRMCCANSRSGPSTLRRNRTWLPDAEAIRGYRYDTIEDPNNIELATRGRPSDREQMAFAGEPLNSHYSAEVVPSDSDQIALADQPSSSEYTADVADETNETSYEAYRHQALTG